MMRGCFPHRVTAPMATPSDPTTSIVSRICQRFPCWEGPAPALANTSTAQLRKNPPTPGVIHVQRRAAGAPAPETIVPQETETGARTTGAVSTGTRAPQQSFNEPRPPTTFFTDDPHRQSGLIYVIMQSYPDKETAEKAADFLTRIGIPCTVV